jgi:hypothetical protein
MIRKYLECKPDISGYNDVIVLVLITDHDSRQALSAFRGLAQLPRKHAIKPVVAARVRL